MSTSVFLALPLALGMVMNKRPYVSYFYPLPEAHEFFQVLFSSIHLLIWLYHDFHFLLSFLKSHGWVLDWYLYSLELSLLPCPQGMTSGVYSFYSHIHGSWEPYLTPSFRCMKLDQVPNLHSGNFEMSSPRERMQQPSLPPLPNLIFSSHCQHTCVPTQLAKGKARL